MTQPQPREAGFNPSSPQSSSGGADSYNHEGTPDTRLTAFSPEENSAKPAKLIKALASGADTGPAKFTTQHGTPYRGGQSDVDKDPFVSSTPARKQEQKLSATASAFRPFSATAAITSPVESTSSEARLPQGQDGACHASPVSARLSTELGLSRCLEVSSPSQAITAAEVERLLAKLGEHGSPIRGTKQIHIRGPAAYLRFANIRDACSVHQNIQLENPTWIVNYVTPSEFFQITHTSVHPASDCEGQLSITALTSTGISPSAGEVESTVLSLICSQGDVFALQKPDIFEPGVFKLVIEYADSGVALGALSKYNGGSVDGINLIISFPKGPGHGLVQAEGHGGIVTPVATPMSTPVRSSSFHDYGRDIYQGMSLAKTPQSASALTTTGHPTPPHLALPVSPQIPIYQPLIFRPFAAPTPYLLDRMPPPHSPTASSIANFGTFTSLYSSPAATAVVPSHHDLTSPRQLRGYNQPPEGRRQGAMRVNRSSYYNAAGHHNHVDVNRIREGIDVRTTIMLRNIPNKVDQAMLKRIVDDSSWGKYDFMYLRIDFANDCNVGYAFINFVDPLDIIDFVNARGNQRWNCFKSDKVAEISYATIQGKDCLVQKFRNSSVMLEAPHYRPKLYFTSNGPMPDLAGQEEAFPAPDNQSKMKRSCENAEHVGLFTPNAGQHFRDEQRRRRSQYDRGTRLAALEEYDIETTFQQMYIA